MTFVRAFLAAAMLAAVAPVATAQTADLIVAGTITPPSCTLTLSNGGVVDLGQINLNTLDPLAVTDLAERTVSVSIACGGAVRFATLATENRAGTAYTPGDANFGLGNTSDGNPIGYYQLVVQTPLADSVASTSIVAATVGSWITPAGDIRVEHGTGNIYTAVGTSAAGPVAATTASWNLRVRPSIAPRDSLALTGTEPLDGSMTLEIVYL
jgi:hypothetical protein